MKWRSSTFTNDHVRLEWRDLWALIRGRVVRDGAMEIALGKWPHERTTHPCGCGVIERDIYEAEAK